MTTEKEDKLKLIADLMLYESDWPYCSNAWFNSLKYTTSWDWLIPVYLKVKTIVEPIGGKHSDLEYQDRWYDLNKLNKSILSCDIEKSFNEVCEMIIKYWKK